MSVESEIENIVVIDSKNASIVVDNSNNITETDSLPDMLPITPDSLIRALKDGNCPSLTGRSTLGYQLGLKDESELYLRLISNTGSGFFSKEWIACSEIEQLITGAAELTSTSFKTLFPNKSVNTGGFVMAVIKAQGLIQSNVLNSRWHEQAKEMTFEQVTIEAMVFAEEAEKSVIPKATGKRKHKEG
ncbi:hypothetical protein [Pseudomonas psychrophila]|uniref:Uncharacterized protein n=1 Tax=Pseudomonas psychrophila TaxID=122355 RepID=A0A8I1KBC2_9PSED|nr:hypothetical protein [Pseudomonas psychrophila]MBJ2259633.1 hypothetical protein [Pseudomonas psychrophila]